MIDAVLAAACAHVSARQGVDKPLGYAIPRVEPFDGQVNEQQLPELLKMTPAVFIAFAAGAGEEQGAARHWKATLSLIAVTRNLATTRAASEGKTTAVGAWRIAEDMALLFDGRTLGLQLDAIEPVSITSLVPGWARTQKAAIVGVTMRTGWTISQAGADAADLDEFLRARFEIDPLLPVTVPVRP